MQRWFYRFSSRPLLRRQMWFVRNPWSLIYLDLLRFAVVLCWGRWLIGVDWVRGHQRLHSQFGHVTTCRLYSQKWCEDFSVSLIVNGRGGDESWMTSVLADDSYTCLRFAIHFVCLVLDCEARKDHLACCHCCRELRYMNLFSVDWGFNHRSKTFN